MSNANKVSYGKPKTGGAVYRAPLGTTLPTDATSTLAVAFKGLGYISDSGLTNSNTMSTTDIKAWGGDTVLNVQTGKDDKFRFELIECLNDEVLKTVYGDNNVTVSANDISVEVNAEPQKSYAWVVEMIMRNGALKRICIPSASVSAIADIAYTDNDASGYDITITATPDNSGNTHYEYIHTA